MYLMVTAIKNKHYYQPEVILYEGTESGGFTPIKYYNPKVGSIGVYSRACLCTYGFFTKDTRNACTKTGFHPRLHEDKYSNTTYLDYDQAIEAFSNAIRVLILKYEVSHGF